MKKIVEQIELDLNRPHLESEKFSFIIHEENDEVDNDNSHNNSEFVEEQEYYEEDEVVEEENYNERENDEELENIYEQEQYSYDFSLNQSGNNKCSIQDEQLLKKLRQHISNNANLENFNEEIELSGEENEESIDKEYNEQVKKNMNDQKYYDSNNQEDLCSEDYENDNIEENEEDDFFIDKSKISRGYYSSTDKYNFYDDNFSNNNIYNKNENNLNKIKNEKAKEKENKYNIDEKNKDEFSKKLKLKLNKLKKKNINFNDEEIVKYISGLTEEDIKNLELLNANDNSNLKVLNCKINAKTLYNQILEPVNNRANNFNLEDLPDTWKYSKKIETPTIIVNNKTYICTNDTNSHEKSKNTQNANQKQPETKNKNLTNSNTNYKGSSYIYSTNKHNSDTKNTKKLDLIITNGNSMVEEVHNITQLKSNNKNLKNKIFKKESCEYSSFISYEKNSNENENTNINLKSLRNFDDKKFDKECKCKKNFHKTHECSNQNTCNKQHKNNGQNQVDYNNSHSIIQNFITPVNNYSNNVNETKKKKNTEHNNNINDKIEIDELVRIIDNAGTSKNSNGNKKKKNKKKNKKNGSIEKEKVKSKNANEKNSSLLKSNFVNPSNTNTIMNDSDDQEIEHFKKLLSNFSVHKNIVTKEIANL
jgi:hypothetical protein